MISVESAARLLDLNKMIGNPQRAQDQLEGAVAVHNILQRSGVAYLADEVGMGKTYVAMSVVALLRHYQPDVRVLIIAPRENIQTKWQREQQVFTSNNLRIDDLRTRMPGGRPARPLVHCRNLLALVREAVVDPDRDFFVRLPSFSLPMRDDPQQRRNVRDRLCAELPWLPDEVLNLRANADELKQRIAQVVNSVLPRFDLVIVDEAHNLKHGLGTNVASRNRVLATVLGRDGTKPPAVLEDAYGPRAGKVLLISATPVDDDYRQLWNQLDVFDRGAPFAVLKEPDAAEDDKRTKIAEFLVRRVTSLSVAGERLTKNLYRREWRQGGVTVHDEPIRITDDRQRLTVALVQKKVSELLGHESFGRRFQVGMLASFESFLQTTGARLDPDDDTAPEVTFDGADQADDLAERQGIDVGMLNGLAQAHYRKFGTELPHPKMDAITHSLASSWRDGEKALVFVRRVASVDELKQKLNRFYDEWIITRLGERLADRHAAGFQQAVDTYRRQSLQRRRAASAPVVSDDEEEDDTGGTDTFFAWYFRGRGPADVISGATIQERFRNRSGPLGTFFDDNHVMALLDAAPGDVLAALATALDRPAAALGTDLRELSRRYLSKAKQPTRGARFDAIQAAALELLTRHRGPYQAMAEITWRELYRSHQLSTPVQADAGPELLETSTLLTHLRQHKALRDAIWPASSGAVDPVTAFREQHLRAQMLSAAARLGHAFIDLYAVVTNHLSSLEAATGIDPDGDIATAYLDELQRQLDRPAAEQDWSGCDELVALADNHDLIIDTTLPETRQAPLKEVPALVGRLFGAQQPVAGMSGQVSRRLVQQFRLPGYPFVLICTDLLQEGEDLHTFCSRVYHYGLAWTPSAIEQRIGRIDRVRSQTERRLTRMDAAPEGPDLLQVFYPHLADTVERLQVRRAMHRLNDFTRLMHEGLAAARTGARHVNVDREMLLGGEIPAPPKGLLTTAFPVRASDLVGEDRPLAVDESLARQQISRFRSLNGADLSGVTVLWEQLQPPGGLLLGTVMLDTGRHQPFSLQLGWETEHLVMRCISPVGLIDQQRNWQQLIASTAIVPVRLGVVKVRGSATYDVTVEEAVILTNADADRGRVGALVRRVTKQADALEQEHLPERDALLTEFRVELERDVRHAG